MKFSVFTASTPEWTPAETARILSAQGWDGIEWRITDQEAAEVPGFWSGNRSTWPLVTIERDAPEIRRITRDAGLGFSGIGGYVGCGDHANVIRMLDLTASVGAPSVRVTMPKLGAGPYRDLFAAARADLEWVSAEAEVRGVKALVELHHGTITASASSALRLVDGLDPRRIGVIHDVGNLVIEGHEDYRAAFELLGAYLAHIHVKNVAWVAEPGVDENGATVWRHEWASLRSGQADLAAYFTSLRALGYDGWVAVEDFSTELPLEERTRDNLGYLRALSERDV